MSNPSVQLPLWALPLVVSVFVGAVSYGAAQANAQATAKEVERVEKIVEKVQASSSEHGKQIALNAQAIKTIADGLAEQAEISKSTDEKLGKLIEIMLESKW